MATRERIGKWEVLSSLGKGGQGEVLLVRDATASDRTNEELVRLFPEQLRMALSNHMTDAPPATRAIIALIRLVADEQSKQTLGALKRLLPMDQAVNAKTAQQRMKQEITVLATIEHPGLVRILDSDIERGWFVMAYLEGRTLADALADYKGKVLEVLVAIRPVVDAVAQLHEKGIVHRDIKPENIFVSNHSLTLGDCGLAIRMDREERLTTTYENAGSRDWMPGWAMGIRLEEVRPTFDVFGLGKVLWAMVSGKPKLRLWYHTRPEFKLTSISPAIPEIDWIQRILDKTVVEHEEDCLRDGAALLQEIDKAIFALRRGAQMPSFSEEMICRFCGVGHYQSGTAPGGYQNHHGFRCPECGHLQVFEFAESQRPPMWRE